MKPTSSQHTTLHGAEALEVLKAAMHIARHATVGVYITSTAEGAHGELNIGPAGFRPEGKVFTLGGLGTEELMKLANQGSQVLWAYRCGDDAQVKLRGRLALRLAHAPQRGEREFPLTVTAQIDLVTVEVPSHGISVQAAFGPPDSTRENTLEDFQGSPFPGQRR